MNFRRTALQSTIWSSFLLIFAAVWISACGSTSKRTVEQKSDEELVSANRMARFAFDNRRYEQAAEINRRALALAYARNDSAAIVNASHNLAACLMQLGHYSDALAIIEITKEEFFKSSENAPADLLLLEATILFRDNRTESALELTEDILQNRPNLSSGLFSRTQFLRGLIFSERNDQEGLRQAIQNMEIPETTVAKSDVAELNGLLAMSENRWEKAIVYFDESIAGRRDLLDYRRMAIALSLSARSCEEAGKTAEAAERFFMAGRSASIRKDFSNARAWLNRAMVLFDRVGNKIMSAESRSLLSKIEEEKTKP